MDKIFLETTIYVILGCGGFAAIYFIGKRLLQYSGDMDRKIIKEAQKEIYEELIEVYWPKLNELMRDGFTVSNINPDSNEKVAADTMVGGATLTKLLGTSAWYAPGAAGAQMVAAILHNQKKLISASALLEGEYGESDLCIGVPCIIGRNGIEKIVTFDLNEEEKALFHKSAEAVHKTNAALAGAI